MARRRIAVMPVIGLGVAATAVSWMITHAVPVTVRSTPELADVAFGRLPFLGDIALTALVMWPICTVLLHLIARAAHRAAPASEQPT